MADLPAIKAFRGLNNVTDPMRLGLGSLERADNVDITADGQMLARKGYDRALQGVLSGAFSTEDHERMYFVDAGELKAMAEPEPVTLRTGLSDARMYWAQINDQVFYNNGIDCGIIQPDNTVLEWAWAEPSAPILEAVTGQLEPGLYQVRCAFTLPDGRLTGSSETAEIELVDGQALSIASIPQRAGCKTRVFIAPANSSVYQFAGEPTGGAMVWNSSPNELLEELETEDFSPLPLEADVLGVWRGRVYASQYFPESKQSALWTSEPLAFHLFDLASSFTVVPGRVLMMAPHDSALVIGTDAAIHALTGDGLAKLAPYGVVPGNHWARDDDDRSVIFWSARGVCRGMPFQNLTAGQVSVAPGLSAGGAIVRTAGHKRYVVSLQAGGTAFNPYHR